MSQPYTFLEEELESYRFSFPIMEKLSKHLSETGGLSGSKIGWHCHLTGLTAAAARVLVGAGAMLYMSECSKATSDSAAIAYMKELGAKVFTGSNSPRQVLAHEPELISDTGFVLSSEYLRDTETKKNYLFAGCEITTSGIQKMREIRNLPFPVLNINDTQLKTLIENYHGVGDGVIAALYRLTGRLWSGRSAAVVGYGRVGAGVAKHLRQAGALVYVVEANPIRKLIAHYDGFGLLELQEALRSCELVVTATGSQSVISTENLRDFRNGIILMNVGHWEQEIDLAGLKEASRSINSIVKHLDEYEFLDAGRGSIKAYVAGGGGPANVVMLTGSPEPTLIHLCTEILCMSHLLKLKSSGASLPPGEHPVAAKIEEDASRLALRSLGLA